MRTLILVFTLLPMGVHAHEKTAAINTSAELVAWCKERSAQQLRQQDKPPYNWSASWWTEVNTLQVEGAWSVNNQPLTVACRIEKHAARKSMVMEIRATRHP